MSLRVFYRYLGFSSPSGIVISGHCGEIVFCWVGNHKPQVCGRCRSDVVVFFFCLIFFFTAARLCPFLLFFFEGVGGCFGEWEFVGWGGGSPLSVAPSGVK